MGVSRDCGHFTVSVNVSGGLRGTRPGTAVETDFGKRTAEALTSIREKHERAILAEWCDAIGWDEKTAAAEVELVQREREDLLEADKNGREERQRRLESGR